MILGLGSRFAGSLLATGEMSTLVFLALRSTPELIGPRFRVILQVTIHQIYFTGIQALTLTGLIAFLLGGIVVIQAITVLSILGASGFIGDVLVIAVLRELGPLITAVVVIARSGTAMAAEMATMRQRGEVDDLEAMGIDPAQYLFLPRLIGAIISLFGLMVYFDTLAVLGGNVALSMQTGSPISTYFGAVTDAITANDLGLIPAKAILFGGLFAVVSCYRGLSVGLSPTEIPRASTGAVVTSLIGVFVLDSILATVVYL